MGGHSGGGGRGGRGGGAGGGATGGADVLRKEIASLEKRLQKADDAWKAANEAHKPISVQKKLLDKRDDLRGQLSGKKTELGYLE